MTKIKKLGKFIVIEGIDGSGKSTQAKLLVGELGRRGIEVELTAEHTDRSAGRLIEEVVRRRQKLDSLALQLVFVADRVDHTKGLITPAMEKGSWVVSDRYRMSTAAYGGDMIGWLWQMQKEITLRPDLTALIDVPADVAMERMGKRGDERTIFEERERLMRVRQEYLRLIEMEDNGVVIDGDRKEKDIAKDVVKEIERRGWGRK